MNSSTLQKSTDEISFFSQFKSYILLGLLGIFLGCLDQYASSSSWIDFDTTLEFWLFLVTLVAVFSKSRLNASIHSIILLVSTVFAYYLMYYLNLGFLPYQLFGIWLIIAVLSCVYALIIWNASQNGIGAAILGSIPTAFLLKQGYYFLPDLLFNPEAAQIRINYFGIDIQSGFNFVAAVVLYSIFFKTTDRRIILTISTIIIFFIFKETSILSFLPF
ncbi:MULTISPECIES: hypothetical protein [Exiguobacterium]|uniref:hypothetical protein n=1 Tax=Exiguobacterium TaxID=33986 RepID=UPI001BE6E53C|nr:MULTISPECIES: hypothetical protein [Exiguobacterium]MCT4784274.1 hypothetical protein [Exiguobacterium himgiriensis]